MPTRDDFDKMDEAVLRKQIVIPLLRALGFQDVYEYHGGSGEQGKDIVCWKPDELGVRQNLVIVAKATQMSGKAQVNKGTAAEIQMQIRQCFGESYTDSVSSEQQDVHRVWVVSNKRISKEAINAIRSGVANPTMMNSVSFIDGDQLWELVEKHLPSSVWHFLEEAQKRVQAVDSHYDPQITISGSEKIITIKEKFPGAAEEKPIRFTTRFVDQQAAEQFYAKIQRFHETGEATDIPDSLIAGVDIPDFLQTLLGVPNLQQSSLRILPAPSYDWIPVKITFSANDGDSYVCNFVRLKIARSGTKEAVVRSEPGDDPLYLEISTRFETRETNVSLRPKLVAHDAVSMSKFLDLSRCLSKSPIFKLEDLRNGLTFAQGQLNSNNIEFPSDGYIALIGLLADIQKKSGIIVLVPERDLTEDEVILIQEVHEIITEGRVECTWDDGKATFQPDQPTLESFITNFADDKAVFLAHDSEETVNLFDTEIPLGHVRQTFHSVKCKNYDEIVARYEELRSGAATITLQLVAGEDNTVVKEYQDWPKNETPMASVESA